MNRATLQWLTKYMTRWLVDRAVGDVKLDSQAGPQRSTYARHNMLLEGDWLKSELGIEFTPDKIEQIRKMDDPSNLSDLARLGRLAAAKQAKATHLLVAFDLPKARA
jgi:hypothetical protein